MNYWKDTINQNVGAKCREVRKAHRVTQSGMSNKIREYMDIQLKKLGFTLIERDNYFAGNIDETLRKKLKNKGIVDEYKPIAASTISKYENGIWDIPIYYLVLMKEIFGDFTL